MQQNPEEYSGSRSKDCYKLDTAGVLLAWFAASFGCSPLLPTDVYNLVVVFICLFGFEVRESFKWQF